MVLVLKNSISHVKMSRSEEEMSDVEDFNEKRMKVSVKSTFVDKLSLFFEVFRTISGILIAVALIIVVVKADGILDKVDNLIDKIDTLIDKVGESVNQTDQNINNVLIPTMTQLLNETIPAELEYYHNLTFGIQMQLATDVQYIKVSVDEIKDATLISVEHIDETLCKIDETFDQFNNNVLTEKVFISLQNLVVNLNRVLYGIQQTNFIEGFDQLVKDIHIMTQILLSTLKPI